MKNEENEVQVEERVPVVDVLFHVLDMMKHMVADPDGKVPDEFLEAFNDVSKDSEGNPMIQTGAGMLMTLPESTEAGVIHYSPNLGAEIFGLAIEISNITKYITTTGYNLNICTPHYVDPQGVVSYGAEAKQVKRHIDTSVLLHTIREMQNETDNKPRLILPDTKIISR